MGATKEKLLYILDILKETDEQHPITTAQIIERLKKHSIEPERKSVLRDIKTLQEYGYEIELAEDNKKGFYLAERTFEDWELKVLIDAVQSASFLTQKDSDDLIRKLCEQASADSGRTLRLMTIPADSKRGDSSTKRVIDTVFSAMRSHKKVRFDYVYTDNNMELVPKHPEGTKPVSPYALVWRKDRYYLIANYREGKTLSYYRLDRIRNAEILSDQRARPLQDVLGSNAEEKLRTFVKKNIYNTRGDLITLRLQVMANGIDSVLDSFGEDVFVRNNDDGTISASICVSDSKGLYTWLMNHGEKVRVLEPLSVKNELVQRLKKMLDYYEED